MLSVSGAVNTIGVPARPVIDHLVEITGTEDVIGEAITMPRGRTVRTIRKASLDEVGDPGAVRGGERDAGLCAAGSHLSQVGLSETRG
jgi:hypothetical protein